MNVKNGQLSDVNAPHRIECKVKTKRDGVIPQTCYVYNTPHVLIALRRSARLLAKRRKEHDLRLLAEETAVSSAQQSANSALRRTGDPSPGSSSRDDHSSLSSVRVPMNVAPEPKSVRARGTSATNEQSIMSEVGQRSDSLTKGDRDVRGPRGINIQRNEPISQDIASTTVVDAVMQATNTNTTAPVMSTGSVDHQRMVVDLSLPSVDTNRKYLPLRTTAPLEPIPIPIDTVDEPEFDKHKVLDAKIDILLENLCKSPDLFDQRFYESMIHTKNWSEQISKGRMRHYLLNDVIYCVIIKILTEKDSSNLKYTLPRSFRRSLTRNEYTIRNGLLYFSGADDTKLAPDQVIWKDFEGRKAHAEGYCVPPKLRNVVMDYFHTALELAHQGMQRLQYLMEGRVYWKGMIADIRRYVKRCQTCHFVVYRVHYNTSF